MKNLVKGWNLHKVSSPSVYLALPSPKSYLSEEKNAHDMFGAFFFK
jgi:hypothetical protein